MHDAQAGARQCAAQDVSLGNCRHEKDQQWQLRMQDCILRKPRTQVFQRRSCLFVCVQADSDHAHNTGLVRLPHGAADHVQGDICWPSDPPFVL